MNGNKQNEMQLADALQQGAASDKKIGWQRDLILLCAAAALVRVPFIFTVPMREAPDEFSHYWVIKYLHDHLHLPGAADVTAGGASAVYGSLPQFGYVPHVVVTLLFPADMLTLAARFGSLLMGLVMIFAACQCGKLLFKERLLALALPATLVVHPQLAFLHSYSNSDSTSSALSSLIILFMLHMIYHGVSIKRATIIGALVGWTALAKFSAVAVIPIVALAIVAATIIHASGWALALSALGIIASLAAALSGWWFARNYYEFNGDILGTKTMYATWAKLFNREQQFYLAPSHIVKDFSWWRMLFFSYWGLFGYMTKYLWRPVYVVYGVFFFASVAALLRTAFLSAKTSFATTKWLTADNCAWTCLTFTLLINIASVIFASVYNLGGPQGRYLFTSEIPIISLIVLGLSMVTAKFGRKLVVAFVVWNLIVCLGSLAYLFSLYGFNAKPF
jgi:hypothetical protein